MRSFEYILNDALRLFWHKVSTSTCVHVDEYVGIEITRMSGRGVKTRPNGTMTQLKF